MVRRALAAQHAMLLPAALILLAQSAAAVLPTQVGTWHAHPNALPNGQLPDVPLLGNGHLGVALDAHDAAHVQNGTHSGPGRANTLDWWLGSNAMWSCVACTDVQTCPAAGLCQTVALGGISFSMLPIFPASTQLLFNASQALSNGTLTGMLITNNGGILSVKTHIHPVNNTVVSSLSWVPGVGDPATVRLRADLWVVGSNAAGQPQGGQPTPSGVGCMSQDGSLVPCSDTASVAALFVARNATMDRSSPAFLVASLVTAMVGVTSTNNVSYEVIEQSPRVWTVAAAFTLGAGDVVSAITGLAETRALQPPTPASIAAFQLLQSALSQPQPAAAIAVASTSWWETFWSKSAISLPDEPQIEALWYGAQYILACSASVDALVPPPGLYGPWVTSDEPGWHGDYTLDYNYESTFYGAFSSNHPEQTASYFPPVTSWMSAAASLAQTEASAGHVECPPNALHYACHLAPWGLQSFDQTVYMHWNGNFAALLFINHWEYTRDAAFALTHTYPLLDGLNTWWACFLNATTNSSAPGGYQYEDVNSFNPDEQHEGSPVPNPQIGLAFIQRSMAAQLDIAITLGLKDIPAFLYDIPTHLVGFNTGTVNASSPHGGFEVWPNTRCHFDSGELPASSVEQCQTACSLSPICDIFTFCASPEVPGCTYGPTCWQFIAACNGTCLPSANWTSGVKLSPPTAVEVWTACSDDSCSSDEFSLYPLWPSEYITTVNNSRAMSIAQSSSVIYSNFATGRPVDLFPAAVLAGDSPPPGSNPTGISWSRGDVWTGLREYMATYLGANLLAYAPGGGVENVGISRAINDALVTVEAGTDTIRLFRMWPLNSSASFQGLLVKGGFQVSADYSGANSSVISPVTLTLVYTTGASSANCSLRNPWPAVALADITVTCNDTLVPAALNGGVITFQAPQSQPCLVATA